ncbi:SphA family protein [Oceanobacter mangrovi]|uniref:SphA family protein n=1 Tax=Oceanobacter mangrovi TaxID=2862510 RepID=UPI001C8DC6B0|nr:transporter [Oceanobacter mangrovi]
MKTNTLNLLAGPAIAAALLISPVSQAYDLPVVNLGLTSFLDGGVPAGPGLYAQAYYQSYSASKLKDENGDALGLPKTDLDYQVMVAQLTWLSTYRVGNASLGINALLPLVTSMDVDDGINNMALSAQSGTGDVLVGPFIQFDPVMGAAGPKFVQRIELQFNLPTGDYDADTSINPSANALSFNPYWAGTYWFTPQWTASARLHYLYNSKNTDPATAFGDVDSTQAGQAIHANLAVSRDLGKGWRLGLNGYFLEQITDTKVDGKAVSGRKESVYAVGPGAMYSFSADNHIVANGYREFGAENRPEGSRVQVRWIHHF